MAKIDLHKVSVEFPVYSSNALSFKKRFIRLATGGAVLQDANHHVVVRALSDVSLNLQHGDRVGLVGHNGSGKSTLLKLLANIYEPTQGTLSVDGKVSSLLNLMEGIEGEFTGYENIMLRGTLMGLTKLQIKARIDEISEFTGLGDYLAMPTRTYSAGMMVRLAFAISASIQPEILLIDEVFGVGDASFIEKAKTKMLSLLNESSIVVMATHTNELIREICNKALLLEGGRIKHFGTVDEVLALYN